jgi:transcriptional antiterminator NusG
MTEHHENDHAAPLATEGDSNGTHAESPPSDFEVFESTPDGGPAILADAAEPPPPARPEAPPKAAEEHEPAEPAPRKRAPAAPRPPIIHEEVDEPEPEPVLQWYVLKVQSGREDTIRDALERRVKQYGLDRYFGRIVVPTEKITEMRNNKKRVVERKSYPGYIMVEMEHNTKTWFVIRETPGVGDFVGPPGQPSPMREEEVNKMLGQETAKDEKPAPIRIQVERGDRVKIKDGPFENFEGTVEEVVEQRGLVKVMLIIFNRPTPVDLEYWQVERI